MFINVTDYFIPGIVFYVFLGGRGVGKTYSALDWARCDWQENDKGFVLLRRTDEERKLGALFNPFEQINADKGSMIVTSSLGSKVTGFYKGMVTEEGVKADGAPIGYLLALSTIAGVRGLGLNMDFVDKIIYDEFIAEQHVRNLKNEGEAILNAYETINRNREMLGRDPAKMIFLANSNSLANPLFITLGIVREVERMLAQGKSGIIDKKRRLAIFFLDDAEFHAEKQRTALYELAGRSDFSSMALNNEFSHDDFSNVRSFSIKGAHPVYQIGEKIHCWRSSDGHLLITYAPGKFSYVYNPKNSADVMLGNQRHAMRAKKDYAYGLTYFESFELKDAWLDFFGIK